MHVLSDPIWEVHVYKKGTVTPKVVGMSIVLKPYTDAAADGRVISKGNINAVAGATPADTVTKYIVTFPVLRSDIPGANVPTYFWGFKSTQDWVDPAVV